MGCDFSASPSVELILWSAVGRHLIDIGEPQRALISFKKAENYARPVDRPWLRIAQSECLAALGQTHAATTLLSEPLASTDPKVAAAANASLGCAKLKAASFQQGAQLLGKALSDSTISWPTKSYAEADLALAMLIIGETDQGLKSLHAAQSKFEIQRNFGALLQSLDNELRLLQHEGRSEAADKVRRRMAELELRQSN